MAKQVAKVINSHSFQIVSFLLVLHHLSFPPIFLVSLGLVLPGRLNTVVLFCSLDQISLGLIYPWCFAVLFKGCYSLE